jgi:hypothetical protein
VAAGAFAAITEVIPRFQLVKPPSLRPAHIRCFLLSGILRWHRFMVNQIFVCYFYFLILFFLSMLFIKDYFLIEIRH